MQEGDHGGEIIRKATEMARRFLEEFKRLLAETFSQLSGRIQSHEQQAAAIHVVGTEISDALISIEERQYMEHYNPDDFLMNTPDGVEEGLQRWRRANREKKGQEPRLIEIMRSFQEIIGERISALVNTSENSEVNSEARKRMQEILRYGNENEINNILEQINSINREMHKLEEEIGQLAPDFDLSVDRETMLSNAREIQGIMGRILEYLQTRNSRDSSLNTLVFRVLDDYRLFLVDNPKEIIPYNLGDYQESVWDHPMEEGIDMEHSLLTFGVSVQRSYTKREAMSLLPVSKVTADPEIITQERLQIDILNKMIRMYMDNPGSLSADRIQDFIDNIPENISKTIMQDAISTVIPFFGLITMQESQLRNNIKEAGIFIHDNQPLDDTIVNQVIGRAEERDIDIDKDELREDLNSLNEQKQFFYNFIIRIGINLLRGCFTYLEKEEDEKERLAMMHQELPPPEEISSLFNTAIENNLDTLTDEMRKRIEELKKNDLPPKE